MIYFFFPFLLGSWVKEEPETAFTALDDFLLLRSLEAILPTLFDVLSLGIAFRIYPIT